MLPSVTLPPRLPSCSEPNVLERCLLSVPVSPSHSLTHSLTLPLPFSLSLTCTITLPRSHTPLRPSSNSSPSYSPHPCHHLRCRRRCRRRPTSLATCVCRAAALFSPACRVQPLEGVSCVCVHEVEFTDGDTIRRVAQTPPPSLVILPSAHLFFLITLLSNRSPPSSFLPPLQADM